MKENAGACGQALESVRIGPSASNRQPWRIIREGASCHFFLARTPGYDKMTGEIRLQEVDMGIALCHFELAAEELGIAGSWQQAKPGIQRRDVGVRSELGHKIVTAPSLSTGARHGISFQRP